MLILTRKTDQGIVLGNDITIRVLSVDGDRVKLGISAPSSVLVLREELCDAVRQENQSAAEAGPAGIAALRGSVQAIKDQRTP